MRGNRYPTSQGAGQPIVGNTTATKASQWKFVARTDNANSFDIINRADSTYISPASANNKALNTAKERPTAGWQIKEADTEGYFIIFSGTSQFNQTTFSPFSVYNWGYNTNVKPNDYRTDAPAANTVSNSSTPS